MHEDFRIWYLVAAVQFFGLGTIQFSLSFLPAPRLRRALRVLAFLPVAAGVGLMLWALADPRVGSAIAGSSVVTVLWAGLPTVCALAGSLIGWKLGKARRNNETCKSAETADETGCVEE